MSAPKQQEPVVRVPTVAAWHRWLRAHHSSSGPVWLHLLKKGAAKSFTYAEALDAALAWGWIDSQKRALDDTAWLQRFSRRTTKSPWSKINRTKAEALITAGAMQPAGLAEVERAKADGRWERAYDGAKTSTVPEDLVTALEQARGAKAFFDALDGANRFAILYRVQTATNPTTRANRIARLVALCAEGKTLHPPRRKRAAK